MRLEKPRVEPLTDEQLAPELKVQLGGRVLNIFRTLAHHPKLMKRWLVFGNHILAKSTLSPKLPRLLLQPPVGALVRLRLRGTCWVGPDVMHVLHCGHHLCNCEMAG